MIELVVPTLTKTDKLWKMLPQYLAHPFITNVHIMDNSLEFYNFFQSDHYKLKVYKPPTYNKWVINEAWNIGVSKCKQNSIVGVLNDDLEFDVKVFDWLADNSANIGILGMHTDNYKLEQDETLQVIDIPQHMHGWGCMFFFEKRDWSIIPPQLKLYFGDTWQFHMNETPCKALKGLSLINSNISETTARGEFFAEFNQMYIFERTWFYQNVQQQNYNLGYVK